jgi:N-dimethylarginine dimethylaminohydrolase
MSADGSTEKINKRCLARQFSGLVRSLRRQGLYVSILPSALGFDDQIFTANPFMTLPPAVPGAAPRAVIGRMALLHRQGEPEYFKKFFEACGYDIVEFSRDVENFECTGDVIRIPGKNFAFANVRSRTSLTALEELTRLTDLHLGVLATRGPFYHLDTALFIAPNPLAPYRPFIVYWPGAFTPAVLQMIDYFFSPEQQILIPDRQEAECGFAGNGFGLPSQKTPTVVMARGVPKTVNVLRARGLRVLEIEFSEIHKGGGSVFCCKGLWYGPAWDLHKALGESYRVVASTRPADFKFKVSTRP